MALQSCWLPVAREIRPVDLPPPTNASRRDRGPTTLSGVLRIKLLGFLKVKKKLLKFEELTCLG